MKRKHIERNIAVALFFAVMIAFSLADRDSKKLHKLYLGAVKDAQKKLTAQLKPSQQSSTRN